MVGRWSVDGRSVGGLLCVCCVWCGVVCVCVCVFYSSPYADRFLCLKHINPMDFYHMT